MAARRVLLIEDDAGAREGLGRLLTEDGHLVRTAASGEHGLACLSGFDADVVVCDFTLPGMNGLQVLRRLREWGRDVCFVILTAGGGDLEEQHALRTEADIFLTKPVDLPRFRALLLAEPRAALPPPLRATS